MINENIRLLAEEILGKTDAIPLAQFDPAQHKAERWRLIAMRVCSVSSAERREFRRRSGGCEPFVELASVLPLEERPACAANVLTEGESIAKAIDLYESLLGQDFTAGAADAGAKRSGDSVSRKQAGAYYTPTDLAEVSVRAACEKLIENRLAIEAFATREDLTRSQKEAIVEVLAHAKVVDLSCGVGRFLAAYARFVLALVIRWSGDEGAASVAPKLLGNIEGYDVDPVALGLARLDIARQFSAIKGVPTHAVEALMGHFAVVNPLLQRVDDGTSTWQSDIASGQIYTARIGRRPGFLDKRYDLILGNPPWEKIRIEEREFLTHLHSAIDVGTTKRERDAAIARLEAKAPYVYAYLMQMRGALQTARRQICEDPLFEHSAVGELNTCNLFLELSARLVARPAGVVALLVKTSTLTHFANRKLFDFLTREELLDSVFDFQNTNKIFAIDSRERFSLVLLSHGAERIKLSVGLTRAEQLEPAKAELMLSLDDLRALNPDTGMLFVPQAPKNMGVLNRIYGANTTFAEAYPNAKFGRLVHLTMHAQEISKARHDGWLGVQEGKFIERYDGRFATFADVDSDAMYTRRASARRMTDEEKSDPGCVPTERYFISQRTWERLTRNYPEKWSIFWRSTTSASNRRTCIATVLPHVPAIQSLQMAQLPGRSCLDIAILLAVMNSAVFDFVVRNKLSGIDLTQAIVKQAPVPVPSVWDQEVLYDGVHAPLAELVACRVAELLKPDARLREFVKELGQAHPPSKGESASALMGELDDLIFIAYGLSDKDRATIEGWKKAGARSST